MFNLTGGVSRVKYIPPQDGLIISLANPLTIGSYPNLNPMVVLQSRGTSLYLRHGKYFHGYHPPRFEIWFVGVRW